MNTMSKKTIRDYIYYLETLKDIKEISSIAEANFRTALKESDENSLEALKPKIDINLDEKEEIIRWFCNYRNQNKEKVSSPFAHMRRDRERRSLFR